MATIWTKDKEIESQENPKLDSKVAESKENATKEKGGFIPVQGLKPRKRKKMMTSDGFMPVGKKNKYNA